MRIDALFSRLAALLLIAALATPRISLSANGAGGLRLEDLFLASALFLTLPRLVSMTRNATRVSGPVVAYSLMLFIQLLSSFFAVLRGDLTIDESLPIVLKLAEFVLPATVMSALFTRDRTVVGRWALLLLQLVFVIFLLLDLLELNFTARFSGRATGNTGGPYEAAMIAGFLASYALYVQGSLPRYLLAVVALVTTQSRITLIAMILLVTRHLRRMLIKVGPAPFAIAIGVTLLALAVALPESGIVKRLQESSKDSGVPMANLIRSIQAPASRLAYFDLTYNSQSTFDLVNQSSDGSTTVRVIRWTALIKLTFSRLDRFLFGNGPGYVGLAMDGAYTRLFVESGAIGLGFYIWFLIRAFRSTDNPLLREYLILLMVSAAFIDLFYSMKVMLLLWMLISLSRHQHLNRRDVRRAVARVLRPIPRAPVRASLPPLPPPVRHPLQR